MSLAHPARSRPGAVNPFGRSAFVLCVRAVCYSRTPGPDTRCGLYSRRRKRSSLSAIGNSGPAQKKPNFTRGFGLDIPEEEVEEAALTMNVTGRPRKRVNGCLLRWAIRGISV